jgi:ribosomal protein S10
MKLLNLLVKSKNKKSLNNFFIFFYKNIFSIKHFFFIKNIFIKKNKKTTITILKSPHVNKIAQEQFEIKYISKQIYIYTIHPFKLTIFLKKLKIFVFSDITIKIKLIHNKKKRNTINKNFFDVNNYYSNKLNYQQNHNKIQNCELDKKNVLNNNLTLISTDSKKMLQIFDVYGKY